MKIKLLVIPITLMMVGVCRAETLEYNPAIEYTPEQRQKIITTLETDNRLLDVEIENCERKKKGWIAATVIGGAGVVSTGIAAAVQGKKLSNQKATINQQNKDISDLETQKTELESK